MNKNLNYSTLNSDTRRSAGSHFWVKIKDNVRGGLIIFVALMVFFFDVALAHAQELPIYPKLYNDAEKEAQQRAGIQMIEEFNQAAASGDKEFTVAPGVYRLPKGSDVFRFNNKTEGFRLNLKGVEIILANDGDLFRIHNIKGLEILGPAIIDSDPLAYAQGRVMRFSASNRTVTMQIDEGFSLETEVKLVNAFSPEGVFLKNPQWNQCTNYKVVDEEKRIVTFTVGSAKDNDQEIFVKGNRLVIGYGKTIFSCINVQDLTLSDIDLYHGGGLLWGQRCAGNWLIRRVRSIPRPGTRRLTGGYSTQADFTKGSFVMEECVFQTNTDDLMDLQMGNLMVCCKQESPETVLLYAGVPEVGDNLRFYSQNEFKVVSDATVVKVERLSPEVAKPYEDDLMMRVQQNQVSIRHAPGANRPVARVVLNKAVDGRNYVFVENKSLKLDVTIKNCQWSDSSTRVMIQGCTSALIEGNTFTRVSGGLDLCTDSWWLEGGTCSNVVIRNNIFNETSQRIGHASGEAAINIRPGSRARPKNAKIYAFENITIEGNKITNSSGGAITIANASKIKISGNTVNGAFLEKSPAGVIRLEACEDIMLGSNTINRSPGERVTLIDCRNAVR